MTNEVRKVSRLFDHKQKLNFVNASNPLSLQLNLQLNRRQVDTNEDLALDIPNPDAGTLVLIMGLANDLRGDNSYGIITNKNASIRPLSSYLV